MTIQNKMAKGTIWSIVEKGGQQLVSFLLFMIIARLIGPEEYGAAMLCFIVLTFSLMLLMGMGEGVITLQLEDEFKLSELFWVISSIGGGLSLLCFFSANIAADLLKTDSLTSLFQWFSPVPLLIGLMIVPHMLILKTMDFKIYAIRSLIATTGSGIVGLAFAFSGYGAHSIIFQQIALYALTNIILWFYIEWRPKFPILNVANLKEVVRPGLEMMKANTLTFSEQQIPRIFVGRFLGSMNLGYFAFSFRMRFALQEILISPVVVPLFPVLSQIKDNQELQVDILENLFFLVSLVIFPINILAILTAPLYVPILFGVEWNDAIPLLQLFLGLGLFTPFIATSTAIFRAYNKVNILVRVQFLIILSYLIVIYFASHLDLEIVGLCVFLFELVRLPIYFLLIKTLIGINLLKHFKVMSKSIYSTVAMGATVYVFINFSSTGDNMIDFVIATLLGIMVYILLSLLTQRKKVFNSVKQLKFLIRSKA